MLVSFISELPHPFLLFVIFCFGASIGSFLNVVIDRLPQDLSLISQRSFCMSCKTPLKWYDLVPLASWLCLRGKCRTCHVKIPKRIFFVELGVGSFGLFCMWYFDALSGNLAALRAMDAFILGAILVPVMLIDWSFWIIPLSLPILALINGVVVRGILLGDPWLDLIGGAAFGLISFSGLLLFFTWLMRRRQRIKADETALGWGDVWLVTAIGANVGAMHFSWVMLFAGIQGIVAFFILNATQKVFLGSRDAQELPIGIPENAIPFGTFLALATIEVRFLF